MIERHEARIILPTYYHDGDHIKHAGVHRKYFEAELIRLFEGFTRTSGWGSWFNPKTGEAETEAVDIYDIAIDVVDGSILMSLADEMREKLHQQVIYVRLPSTGVGFVG